MSGTYTENRIKKVKPLELVMSKQDKISDYDTLWYKDAVFYQLHVKTFFDGNGDGIGDFLGLTQKLDYLRNLGITTIWLLPFYPSPLKDDGYDIADYYNIHPQYGTLKDFKEFLKQAHKRGLKVVTELVINHTSDQHSWFKRARQSPPGSPYRDYYVWSDTAEKYKDARIIFKDFEHSNWTWDPVANAYYWHRFYSHQPDLNFDSLALQKEILKVADFWFGMGVDGVRLDAIPYLFEREGTNCENLPETYEFLRKFRAHVDNKFKNKMLLAEANQWPEDAVRYFGEGNQCHMAFHFPLMPRMYMALQMEDRYPIIDILEQTPSLPDICQWGIFLRNHDELTLEMVTDEERDYMYRSYAENTRMKINLGIRRRLIPLLDNDRKKIELMNILLFSLLGTPIIYYGDEIGMGDNYYLGDRDGVRTPMQWSPDRNAGFSTANPQQLYLPAIIDPEYHYETVNVETQERNFSSLLWWMRRVIDKRKKFKAFSRGSLEFLLPDNPKVLSFIRKFEDETILVVINLSRFCQAVQLDLSKYKEWIPEEVFSCNRFPRIKEGAYTFTLSPHAHYWLLLKEEHKAASHASQDKLPELKANKSWDEIFEDKGISRLEREILPPYLQKCRWYGGKSRTLSNVKILSILPFPNINSDVRLLIFETKYTEGLSSSYILPLSIMSKDKASQLIKDNPRSIIANLKISDRENVIYDGAYNKNFHNDTFSLIAQKKRLKLKDGDLTGNPSEKFRKLLRQHRLDPATEVIKAEQSNTSIIYDKTYYLKLFRRLEEGINPDTEITKYLTETRGFKHVPAFVGAVEFHRPKKEPIVLCLMQEYISNEGDAWSFTFDQLKGFYERVLADQKNLDKNFKIPSSMLDINFDNVPDVVLNQIGSFYLEMIKLLGKRTAEMHMAFASDFESPDFSPEPFSTLYQRSVYQSMRSLANRVLQQLNKNITKLPKENKKQAKKIINMSSKIQDCLKRILSKKLSAMKIRIHGDYHLGQVLYTGKDFMILDFEGEPIRSLGERRLKKSALRDIAGMIRSFHYAAYGALYLNTSVRTEDVAILDKWADTWYHVVSGIFLHSYLSTIGKSTFVPQKREEFEILLEAFFLEKSIYELGYELNNRPDWISIPLRGILKILENSKSKF